MFDIGRTQAEESELFQDDGFIGLFRSCEDYRKVHEARLCAYK